jgi:hypothetical protein
MLHRSARANAIARTGARQPSPPPIPHAAPRRRETTKTEFAIVHANLAHGHAPTPFSDTLMHCRNRAREHAPTPFSDVCRMYVILMIRKMRKKW